MSTSLIYHAFNLRGIRYRSVKYTARAIILNAQMTDQCIKCPDCNQRRFIYKGNKNRRFVVSPLGRKHCFLDLELQRVLSVGCRKLFWPQLPFMDGKHRWLISQNQVVTLSTMRSDRSLLDNIGAAGWYMQPDDIGTLRMQFRNQQAVSNREPLI